MEGKQLEENKTEKEEQPQNNDGSSYGKFSCVEDLEKAYENLEKEFTRKSQLLSQLLKKEEERDNALAENNQQNQQMGLPFFERENWAEQVKDFLQKNPQAKPYAKEISQIAIEDKELQFCNNPLLVAWQKWLTKNYKSTSELLEDENFVQNVKQNEKIRKAIIDDYVKQLNNREIAPPIYSSFGFSGIKTRSFNTTSLEEAKELAKKIFNK